MRHTYTKFLFIYKVLKMVVHFNYDIQMEDQITLRPGERSNSSGLNTFSCLPHIRSRVVYDHS